jgi:hypothetical protein
LRKRLFFLIGLTLAVLFCSQAAFAIEVVRIDKGKIRLNIPAGQKKVGVITVENPSAEPKSVKVYLEDWIYVNPFDGSKEFRPAGSTGLSCADWITFSPSELTLAPYAKQKINYTVTVPDGTEGGHYAILFFEGLLGRPDSEGVGVSVAVRMGTIFYIEAAGSEKKDVAISGFSLKKESEKSPLKMELGLKNQGNVDITAGGNFNLIDKKGMVFARGEFSNVYTFPGDSALLSASWSLPVPKGVYDLILTLDLGKAQEEAGLGRGPIIVKEAAVEIGQNQDILSVGELK